ncbi:MAG: hypothetical protein VXV85_01000, partial [Candidatus Thermoplasmatota archaeon]|nr:hypothetical protein [Candidatus Thermoplasmatota archaeon]
KLDQFQNQIESSFTAMQTSFDYLMKTIDKNPERIIFDVENIIVLGNLATYTIPVKSVLSKLKNPFVGGGGLQATRTTRKGELKGKETNVCIQPDYKNVSELPGCDVLDSYFLMLLNDDKFILQKDHGPLRRAMLMLYGLSVSPASEVMKTWIDSTTGGEYKPEESAIEIKGTHGWKWRVSDANPLVNGFTIWFKKKHQRKWTKVVTDSTNFEYNYHYDDVLSILELLSDSPRVLIHDEPYASDEYFMQQVAKHHAPVAQRIENDRAEQAVS